MHYNRYNCSFNPEGTADIPIPELGVEFDFIVAYSVFTHIAREEMHDLVGQLRARLKPWGTLAFTFIDPINRAGRQPTRATTCDGDWNRPVQPKPPSMSPAFSRRVVAGPGVPGGRSRTPCRERRHRGLRQLMSYHVFYTAEFLQQEFPDAKILPPVNGEMQGCCLLRRAASAP